MALRAALRALPRVAEPGEGPIVVQSVATSADRDLQAFYDERPYRRLRDARPLAERVAQLERDWAQWADPVSLRGARSLDAGCGCGANLVLHAALAEVAVGVDLSLAALREARREAKRHGLGERVTLMRQDLANLGLPALSFDVITCVGVLHHLADHRPALTSLARLLAPGGALLLGVYHHDGRAAHRARREVVARRATDRPGRAVDGRVAVAMELYDIHAEAARRRVAPEVYAWDTYAVPTERGFTARGLREELGALGLRLVDVRPSPTVAFELPLASPVDDEGAQRADRALAAAGREHFWCLARRARGSRP